MMSKRGQTSGSDPRTRFRILVTCDDCGDVTVAGEHTVLVRHDRSDTVTLAYRCNHCGIRSATPVPESQLARLVARGFPFRSLGAPAELFEPRPIGPPFTADDVLDAHELLAGTDYITQLLAP